MKTHMAENSIHQNYMNFYDKLCVYLQIVMVNLTVWNLSRNNRLAYIFGEHGKAGQEMVLCTYGHLLLSLTTRSRDMDLPMRKKVPPS